MVDRRYVGDFALALLLALPLAGLAKPPTFIHHHLTGPAAISAASADRAPEGRISVLG